MRTIGRQGVSSLNANPQVWLVPALLCSFLIVAFMPFNALFIQWNNSMSLPEWLSGLERWMQEKETALKELTEYITSFDTIPQLLVGMIVIALIPAIGEELVFRGLLQPRVQRFTHNMHAAVWITGFVFSAIHFQFYGLIPRMLLGVLLGYLYVWSGNLWYPIIGHFTNNGFTLLMIYLYKKRTVDIDIESTSAVSVSTALFSLLITIGLIYTLKQYYFKDKAPAYE
jgi:membrane protease YdiL (CAAX protease family)